MLIHGVSVIPNFFANYRSHDKILKFPLQRKENYYILSCYLWIGEKFEEKNISNMANIIFNFVVWKDYILIGSKFNTSYNLTSQIVASLLTSIIILNVSHTRKGFQNFSPIHR